MLKITRKGKCLLAKFTIPITAVLIATASMQASAMQIKNCSGVDVRVHVYNNKDFVMTAAKSGGLVKHNAVENFHASKALHKIRVFKSEQVFDVLMLTKSNLNGHWAYAIKLVDGDWRVVEAGHPIKNCKQL